MNEYQNFLATRLDLLLTNKSLKSGLSSEQISMVAGYLKSIQNYIRRKGEVQYEVFKSKLTQCIESISSLKETSEEQKKFLREYLLCALNHMQEILQYYENRNKSLVISTQFSEEIPLFGYGVSDDIKQYYRDFIRAWNKQTWLPKKINLQQVMWFTSLGLSFLGSIGEESSFGPVTRFPLNFGALAYAWFMVLGENRYNDLILTEVKGYEKSLWLRNFNFLNALKSVILRQPAIDKDRRLITEDLYNIAMIPSDKFMEHAKELLICLPDNSELKNALTNGVNEAQRIHERDQTHPTYQDQVAGLYVIVMTLLVTQIFFGFYEYIGPEVLLLVFAVRHYLQPWLSTSLMDQFDFASDCDFDDKITEIEEETFSEENQNGIPQLKACLLDCINSQKDKKYSERNVLKFLEDEIGDDYQGLDRFFKSIKEDENYLNQKHPYFDKAAKNNKYSATKNCVLKIIKIYLIRIAEQLENNDYIDRSSKLTHLRSMRHLPMVGAQRKRVNFWGALKQTETATCMTINKIIEQVQKQKDDPAKRITLCLSKLINDFEKEVQSLPQDSEPSEKQIRMRNDGAKMIREFLKLGNIDIEYKLDFLTKCEDVSLFKEKYINPSSSAHISVVQYEIRDKIEELREKVSTAEKQQEEVSAALNSDSGDKSAPCLAALS